MVRPFYHGAVARCVGHRGEHVHFFCARYARNGVHATAFTFYQASFCSRGAGSRRAIGSSAAPGQPSFIRPSASVGSFYFQYNVALAINFRKPRPLFWRRLHSKVFIRKLAFSPAFFFQCKRQTPCFGAANCFGVAATQFILKSPPECQPCALKFKAPNNAILVE